MPRPPIVLLTDFGTEGLYAGVLKASILAVAPGASMVDLSHAVPPQDIAHGAILLETAYDYFPRGSVFVCVVDPGVGTSRRVVAARTKRYFFIAPDNGLLAPALEREGRVRIRAVENPRYFRTRRPSSTFHGRDIMAPAAAHLVRSRGRVFERLGPALSRLRPLNLPEPRISGRKIAGEIVSFDPYGNAFTNIRRGHAPAGFWSSARVFVKGRRLGRLRETYGRAKRLCALFNSFARLEIALPNGSAQKAGRLRKGDPVRVSA